MSDHPREAQRNLRKIFICADIWLDDIFYFFDPAKVGLEFALVSDRFDALVDTHFRTRKWALRRLDIKEIMCPKKGICAKIVKYESNGSIVHLPIPTESLPRNVIGFEHLVIHYLDHKVIAFLRRIRRLFKSDFALAPDMFPLLYDPEFSDSFPWFMRQAKKTWVILATKIWPLLSKWDGIREMQFQAMHNLNDLRTHFSPTILRDCPNLRSIAFGAYVYPDVDDSNGSREVQLQFPPDDSDRSTNEQALCKWLHTPLENGRPKMLGTCDYGYCDWVDQLKKTFLCATTSVCFYIKVTSFGLVPFELENSRTRERLALRCTENSFGVIERGPISTKAQQALEGIHYNVLCIAQQVPYRFFKSKVKAGPRKLKRLRQKGAGPSREGK